MSVQSEIDRINENVANTYTALSEMGATMPQQRNSNNLPGTVRTVPQGGGGGGTSVQTDWNQTDETAPDFLKNKPFGDFLNGSDTLALPGLEIFASQFSESNIPVIDSTETFVKVSNISLTIEDFSNACFIMAESGENIELSYEEILPYAVNGAIIFDCFCSIPTDNFTYEDMTFPEKGLYFNPGMWIVKLTIYGYMGFPFSKKLDGKYLPADIRILNTTDFLPLDVSFEEIISNVYSHSSYFLQVHVDDIWLLLPMTTVYPDKIIFSNVSCNSLGGFMLTSVTMTPDGNLSYNSKDIT